MDEIANADLFGAHVTRDFPNHKAVPGTVTRTTEHSIYVTFQHPSGTTPTHRFMKHAPSGEWRKVGTGPHASKLKFV